METATNQAEKLHKDEKLLQSRIEQRREAGLLAFKALCGTEFNVPQDLAEAAALASRLKNARDANKQTVGVLEEQVKELSNLIRKAEEETKATFMELLAGEPQNQKPDKTAVAKLIAQLRIDKELAETAAKVSANALTDVFIEMGLNKIPGALNVFIGQTPLAVAAEGAAIHLFGDDVAKQAYLRRRGWRFVGNGAWHGSKGVVPFATAVDMQVKADVSPFKGLGHRAYEPKTNAEIEEI